MNRSEINRSLAKALAYANCCQFEQAQRWGEVLLRQLELAGVFKVGAVVVKEPLTLWSHAMQSDAMQQACAAIAKAEGAQ